MLSFPSPLFAKGAGPALTTTSWLFPGSVLSSGGGAAWSSPTNIGADDNAEASATILGAPATLAPTEYLCGYNWGFSIPGGSVVTLVEVAVGLRANSTIIRSDTRYFMRDVPGQVDMTGIVSPDSWENDTVDHQHIYSILGTDTGGFAPVTAALINGSAWGFGIRAQANGPGPFLGDSPVYIDYMKARCTYLT